MKYIKRSSEGVMIVNKDIKYQTKGLKQYINSMCLCNLSTFEGRAKAASVLLKRKNVLPIHVNKKITLFPTESLRNYNCIYVNYMELLSYKAISNKETKIVFYDLSELIVSVTYQKIRKQVLRVQTILEYKNN